MKTSVALLHWLPRILCMLSIIFISMFALDAFAPGLTLWRQTLGFLIHLIPSFVLLALLIVAWKWKFTGGLLFLLIGIASIPFIFSHNYARTHSFWISLGIVLMINFPFIIVGILFMISHRIKN